MGLNWLKANFAYLVSWLCKSMTGKNKDPNHASTAHFTGMEYMSTEIKSISHITSPKHLMFGSEDDLNIFHKGWLNQSFNEWGMKLFVGQPYYTGSVKNSNLSMLYTKYVFFGAHIPSKKFVLPNKKPTHWFMEWLQMELQCISTYLVTLNSNLR